MIRCAPLQGNTEEALLRHIGVTPLPAQPGFDVPTITHTTIRVCELLASGGAGSHAFPVCATCVAIARATG